MRENTISTLSEYFHTIEVLQRHYPNGVFGNPVSGHFLYRGLPDEKYQLLPGIFRKQTDFEESLKIENSKYCTWTDEMGLLNGFIHEASSLLPIPPDNRLRWAEYAQHYGVPTRFLDLTSNPLVALYFCCRDQKNRNGTVWLLHAINYKRFFNKSTTIKEHKKIKEIISELLEGKSDVEYPVLYTPYAHTDEFSKQLLSRMGKQKRFLGRYAIG